jgi:predicted Fe-S protein YdhL (DUF1289 family)
LSQARSILAAKVIGNIMIASPCIGLCRIDDSSGLCLGCARTRAEIATWRDASPEELRQIWAELPLRRKKLGLNMHRLGWDAADLRSFLIDTLRHGGTWTTGVLGAVAEFCIGEDEACHVEAGSATVTAMSPRGGISFHLTDQVRALSFGSPSGRNIVVLAVPRTVAKPFPDQGLVRIGSDHEALREKDRQAILYDFGLGRRAAGFGIRAADADLIVQLESAAGLDWSRFLPMIGADIVRASPTRVVRNPIGRIEVFTPIPAPDGTSPAGPHTHFLPAYLAKESDLPANLDMPEGYVACAIYYPADPETGTSTEEAQQTAQSGGQEPLTLQ